MPTLFGQTHRLSDSEGRFYVPGHKGNPAAIPAFGAVLGWDLTELPGLDDLQRPAGPIAESEAAMTRVYGAGATLYSAAGSTACIEAMLTLFVPPKGKVVMARNCHLAAVRALAFIDAEPVWVLPEDGRPRPDRVRTALEQSGAGVVYITSPDYYGRIADIAALAAVCEEFGARLLVDNAHGAHLRFLPGVGHPLQLGADACCDSAHKTLPCLTPAALLHLGDCALRGAARRALNLYTSTSPSYLVLESLDHAARLLAENPPDFERAGSLLADAAACCPALVQPGDDPLKVCLHPARAGLTYAEVEAGLQAQGVTPELADGQRFVLMASPYNTPADFERLGAALGSLACRASECAPPVAPPVLELPEPVLTVRDAVYAACEETPVQNAVGRIAAECAAPCPPGVPVVVPGERVDEGAATALAAGGISTLGVVK